MKAILIGYGQIAQTHLAAIRALGHEVECVVGRNADRVKAFAVANGIPFGTTDLEAALQCDAEIVHVCTPPTQHTEAIRQSLAAGKHVLSEKPLCLSVAEAEELAALAATSDCVTAVCCNVRFYPANLAAAQRIRSGAIGKPLILSGSYLQEFHAPPHDDGWRFNSALAGDQRAISEIGTHWIDLAYAWTGLRVTAVCAALGNWYPTRYRKDGRLYAAPVGDPVRVDTEDAAAVTLRFENGGIGTLLLSELSRGHFNDLSIEIAGTDGSLRWSESEPQTLSVSDSGTMRTETDAPLLRDETFTGLFRAVYSAAMGLPHESFPTFADGAYVARVCDAIRRSGKSGAWETV